MTTKIKRLAVVSLAALLLAGGGLPAFSADAADAPLDLAAMALLPADEVASILDIATPGFGVDFGEAFPSAAAAAAHQGDILGVDPVTLHMAMAVGGYRRGADVAYLVPVDPQNPNQFPELDLAVSIDIGVDEYVDAGGAAVAFASIRDALARPHPEGMWETQPNAPDLGDEAALSRYTGYGQSGVDVVFRSGNLIATVLVADSSGSKPERERVEVLAARLAQQIEAVRTGTSPALSTRVLRLTGEGVDPSWDAYLRLAGGTITDYYDPNDPDDGPYVYDDIGTATDAYRITQWLRGVTEGPEDDVRYAATLLRFPDEAAAAAWMREEPERLKTDRDLSDITVFGDDVWLTEDTLLGDEALAVTATFTTEEGASEFARVYVRVGAEGVMITLRGLDPRLPPGLPLLTVVEELARAQLRCLEAVSCLEPIPVPEPLAA